MARSISEKTNGIRDDAAHSGAEQRSLATPAPLCAQQLLLFLLCLTVHRNFMASCVLWPETNPLLKLSCTPPAESPGVMSENVGGLPVGVAA